MRRTLVATLCAMLAAACSRSTPPERAQHAAAPPCDRLEQLTTQGRDLNDSATVAALWDLAATVDDDQLAADLTLLARRLGHLTDTPAGHSAAVAAAEADDFSDAAGRVAEFADTRCGIDPI